MGIINKDHKGGFARNAMKGLVSLCNTTIHSSRKPSNFQTKSVSERLQSSLAFHITHLLIGDISESIKVLHIL